MIWSTLRLSLAILLSGCPGILSGGRPALDEAGVPLPPPPVAADAGVAPGGDHKPPQPPKPDLQPPKPPPPSPSPGQLPTWVPLDWAAFPVDRGPSYQVSGKLWVVKQNGDDANPGSDGSPLRTIARALSLAQSGDLVRVHAGSYAEGTPDDYRALVIERDNVILTAAPGESVTVTPKSSYYKKGVVLLGSGVTLNAINLQGFNPSIELGRESGTQKNVVISNLTVKAAPGGADGIVDYAAGNLSIDGLLIKNVSISGAALSISCNSGPCKSWRLENVKVVGSGGSGSGADAIAIENGDNMLFYRVEVSGAQADGIDTKATRVVVWDCHVHDVARNGIKLWEGGDIVNTRVHHTGADAAVVVKSGPRFRMLNSLLAYHNKGGGLGYNLTVRYDDNGQIDVEIVNSIIYNTSGGSYFSSQAKLKIESSLFFGIDNGVILDRGSLHVTQSQGASGLASLGGGNIVADPQLDASFKLKPSSPGVNKGKKLASQFPELDCVDQPRVKNGVPDLGPFEDH